MSEIQLSLYFAGLGFTGLGLTLTDPPSVSAGGFSTPGSTDGPAVANISYDSATGAISFALVGESPDAVRDVLFNGNVTKDSFGNIVMLSGTWAGQRIIVVRAERAAEHPKGARPGAAFPGGPPPVSSLNVQGNWAAVPYNQLE
jgi:hypothetical protein